MPAPGSAPKRSDEDGPIVDSELDSPIGEGASNLDDGVVPDIDPNRPN